MSALLERRRHDLAHLRRLESGTRGKVRFVRGDEHSIRVFLELRCRTVGSRRFPAEVLDVVQVAVDLPEDYPFSAPVATLFPVVFHPNVFASGKVCMGARWLASEGLDIFVRRVIDIVTFRPEPLNLASAANAEAAAWYQRAARDSPGWFPTDEVAVETPRPERPPLQWRDIPTPASESVCSGCGRRLRFDAPPGSRVRCPACGTIFAAPR